MTETQAVDVIGAWRAKRLAAITAEAGVWCAADGDLVHAHCPNTDGVKMIPANLVADILHAWSSGYRATPEDMRAALLTATDHTETWLDECGWDGLVPVVPGSSSSPDCPRCGGSLNVYL